MLTNQSTFKTQYPRHISLKTTIPPTKLIQKPAKHYTHLILLRSKRPESQHARPSAILFKFSFYACSQFLWTLADKKEASAWPNFCIFVLAPKWARIYIRQSSSFGCQISQKLTRLSHTNFWTPNWMRIGTEIELSKSSTNFLNTPTLKKSWHAGCVPERR